MFFDFALQYLYTLLVAVRSEQRSLTQAVTLARQTTLSITLTELFSMISNHCAQFHPRNKRLKKYPVQITINNLKLVCCFAKTASEVIVKIYCFTIRQSYSNDKGIPDFRETAPNGFLSQSGVWVTLLLVLFLVAETYGKQLHFNKNFTTGRTRLEFIKEAIALFVQTELNYSTNY